MDKPTKLAAVMTLLNMAQEEEDEEKRGALLVCIHHTIRRKLHTDRKRFARAMRRNLAAYATAADDIAKGNTALFFESGTAAKMEKPNPTTQGTTT